MKRNSGRDDERVPEEKGRVEQKGDERREYKRGIGEK